MRLWTDDRVETLRLMRAEGYTSRVIAESLNCTRAAVCGAAYRNGMTTQEPRKPFRGLLPRGGARLPNGGRGRLINVPAIVDADIPREQLKTLFDLKPNDCRWPIGDGPILFCAAPKLAGSSYCAGHCMRSIQGAA